MRRNFRRSRKFWHCDKDELATRLSIGTALPLFFSFTPFLFSPFVFLGYLCSCLLQHYLPVVVAVLVVLVRVRVAVGYSLPPVGTCFRTPFLCRGQRHFLSLLSRLQTWEVHFEIYVHTNWKRAEKEKWVKTRKAAHKKSTKEKQQRNGKLGCIFTRIAAVAISQNVDPKEGSGRRGKTASENAFK